GADRRRPDAGAEHPVLRLDGRYGPHGRPARLARATEGGWLRGRAEDRALMTPPGRFFPRDEYYMRTALREAERALEHDDVPIGAVVVREGEVLGAAPNERELRGDPTAHAEVIALREAAGRLGTWRLLDCVLYVTLEP